MIMDMVGQESNELNLGQLEGYHGAHAYFS